MRHIREILKEGAELKARKLDPNDPELNRLIEKTIKEQERVLALNKIDWEKMRNTYITI
jgi:hypothetical protein